MTNFHTTRPLRVGFAAARMAITLAALLGLGHAFAGTPQVGNGLGGDPLPPLITVQSMAASSRTASLAAGARAQRQRAAQDQERKVAPPEGTRPR